METKLYVGNMPYNTTAEDLRRMFTEAGSVIAVDVIIDRQTGKPKGFAFVTMAGEAEAEKAINLFNGKNINDRPLKVSIAKPRLETGTVSNEAPGVRTAEEEIGETRNEAPGERSARREVGRDSNEEPGIRTSEQEIGEVNNEKDS